MKPEEVIGKTLAFGFGDKAFIGVIMRKLDNVTPYDCYEYIVGDKSLFPDGGWQKYKSMVRKAKIGADALNKDSIISALRKYRLDLLSIIINTPNGYDWLDRQVSEMKDKLEIR